MSQVKWHHIPIEFRGQDLVTGKKNMPFLIWHGWTLIQSSLDVSSLRKNQVCMRLFPKLTKEWKNDGWFWYGNMACGRNNLISKVGSNEIMSRYRCILLSWPLVTRTAKLVIAAADVMQKWWRENCFVGFPSIMAIVDTIFVYEMPSLSVRCHLRQS